MGMGVVLKTDAITALQDFPCVARECKQPVLFTVVCQCPIHIMDTVDHRLYCTGPRPV